MALVLYNLVLTALYPVYLIASLINSDVKKFKESRREGMESLNRFIRESLRTSPVWLHAASAGELDQALAIARALKKKFALQQIIISVFSLSVKPKDHPDADLIFYMPVDFFWSWGRIIRDLKPSRFITMTWDVFPNLLFHLNQNAVPAYMANAAIHASSWRLKTFYKKILRNIYARFSGIGCADEESRRLFLELLPDEKRVLLTGDSRYDAILHRISFLSGSRKLSREETFIKNIPGKIMILGSTYFACDRAIFPLLNDLLIENPGWTAVVFPHHTDEKRIRELIMNARLYSLNYFLLSDIISSGNEQEIHQKIKKSEKAAREKINKKNLNIKLLKENFPPVIIADVTGILAHAYRYSEIAYVGGGFHHRIHNTGEPAALGNAVLTGPFIDTSPIAKILEKEQGLIRCSNGPDFFNKAGSLMKNAALRQKTGKLAEASLKSRAGSSEYFLKAFRI